MKNMKMWHIPNADRANERMIVLPLESTISDAILVCAKMGMSGIDAIKTVGIVYVDILEKK